MLKTINCGDVRSEHIGKTITIAGWVHRRRDHGNLIFIDVRDREGIVQVVFNPELSPETHNTAESLRNEWVVQISGRVSARPEGSQNADLATGEIEVYAEQLFVLNESKTPPFSVNEESDVDLIAEFAEGADLFDLIGLEQYLSDQLQLKVDVVTRNSLREEIADSVLADLTPV